MSGFNVLLFFAAQQLQKCRVQILEGGKRGRESLPSKVQAKHTHDPTPWPQTVTKLHICLLFCIKPFLCPTQVEVFIIL